MILMKDCITQYLSRVAAVTLAAVMAVLVGNANWLGPTAINTPVILWLESRELNRQTTPTAGRFTS